MASNWTVPVTDAPCVMMSSDYSQQEPKITGFVAGDEKMCAAFKEGKDIYATIAALAFNRSYEECLEFHPETHEYQPDGKARRGEAKTIVLGICYGRSTVTIGEQLYGKDTSLTEEQRTKKAQGVYDAVLNAFPQLRQLMHNAQATARRMGYVETILGRRRHIPDMTLPEFEFKALAGYVNPDVDPMDVSTLQNKSDIPDRIVDQLRKEFKGYKYFGQIARRTRELHDDDHIKVINNRAKITEASRQCVNCVDAETQILTTQGWKHFYQVKPGDTCYGYNIISGKLEETTVSEVHIYDNADCYPVHTMEHLHFSACATPDHRWVVQDLAGVSKFVTTSQLIESSESIMQAAMFSSKDACEWAESTLKLFAWMHVAGIPNPEDAQSLVVGFPGVLSKSAECANEVAQLLNELNISMSIETSPLYTLICVPTDSGDASAYFGANSELLPGGRLTTEFVSSLTGDAARILIQALMTVQQKMLGVSSDVYLAVSKADRDLIQHLATLAGYATHTSKKCEGESYVCLQNHRMVKSSMLETTEATTPIVWCVTTGLSTWVARRNGTTYITGNSIVQGSAADMTKMAMLMLANNEEWRRLGGHILVPVHDELICEAPIQNYERCAQILSDMMVEAGSFLPFPINCDVEITYRWYGNGYPCPYPQPMSMENLSEDEIKWVQYHLLECEFLLPVIKNADGSKPIGAAAKGINGQVTPEYDAAIQEYIKRNRIPLDEFISHIHRRVDQGV